MEEKDRIIGTDLFELVEKAGRFHEITPDKIPDLIEDMKGPCVELLNYIAENDEAMELVDIADMCSSFAKCYVACQETVDEETFNTFISYYNEFEKALYEIVKDKEFVKIEE